MNKLISRQHSVTLLLIVSLVFTSSCDFGKTPRPSSGPPRIVASFFPLYDFARVLGGEDFDVVCLTPPGGDPHAMSASPRAVQTVADAQLVLLLGFGMDGWVEKLVAGKGHHQVLVAGHGLETKKIQKAILSAHAENDDHHHAHDQHHHDHGSNDMDPHVWLDPLLAQNIVRRMADSMVEIAPQHSVSVFARRDIFLNELQELHEEFTKNLENVSRREVVTFHGAFAYLFARYKLETVGVVEQFPGDEPSAAYLRELVDLMRELKMKVIFAEPQLPERPAQVIAQEIGGRVERLDPCETILSEAPHATYLERQRANLETLRRTLSEP